MPSRREVACPAILRRKLRRRLWASARKVAFGQQRGPGSRVFRRTGLRLGDEAKSLRYDQSLVSRASFSLAGWNPGRDKLRAAPLPQHRGDRVSVVRRIRWVARVDISGRGSYIAAPFSGRCLAVCAFLARRPQHSVERPIDPPPGNALEVQGRGALEKQRGNRTDVPEDRHDAGL